MRGIRIEYGGVAVGAKEGFVPTTSIGRKPAGGGSVHEDVNLLSDRRINTFLADGTSKAFFLDVPSIDSDFVPIVKVNIPALVSCDTVHSATRYTFNGAMFDIRNFINCHINLSPNFYLLFD